VPKKMSFDKRPHLILEVQMYHTCKDRFPDILNIILPAMMKQFAVRYTYFTLYWRIMESSIKILFL